MIIPRTIIALAIAVAAIPASSALKSQPEIRADTNRDGVVDVTDSTDATDKNVWTQTRGAIFLPNIGDAIGRCKDVDALGKPLTNSELAACHDASGDTIFSPEYLAPLRALPVKDVSDSAYAHVTTYPEDIASHIRVFWQPDGANWTYIDPEFRFNASHIRAGLKLGLDSRRLVTDWDEWDGSIRVRFTVFDGAASASDEVAMKLAPVLFHHHLQSVDTVITQLSNDSLPSQQRFVSQLDAARTKSGVKNFITLPDNDVWVQDIMETGYSSMPGPDGKPISLRVIVRTAQRGREAGRQVFTKLRGKGVGAFQPLGKGTFGFREINSGGNIETIPPYTSKVTGEKYPMGRIITGKQHDLLPAESMLKFYKSQELQKPLLIETGWLVIGHVDEFVSFLPANNSLGFTISIADSMLAYDILQKAAAAGHGNNRAFSIGPNQDPFVAIPGPNINITIAEVLAHKETSIDVQKYAAKYIEQNLQVLLAETGLKESEVIRVPTLFHISDIPFPDGFAPSDPVGSPRHYTKAEEGGMVLLSFYPAAINGIVVGKSYITSSAYGPVINGTDVFQHAVADAYKRAGMDAHFIDDFYSHHVGGGDVHCGSNTLRETNVKWW